MNPSEIAAVRYHVSPVQDPYSFKDSESWGTFVRYIELADDAFVLRQVDEFANGYLTRYDRIHWDDQFGSLADFRFDELWISHWGQPVLITLSEFERKWTLAGSSPPMAQRNRSPQSQPPWIKS
jgi:hypothetical protein